MATIRNDMPTTDYSLQTKPTQPQGGEGSAQGVNGQDQGQNTISKSIWSNYDGNRDSNVSSQEAKSNSLFSRSEIQANITTPYSEQVTTQIQKNALKSVDVKGMFQNAISKFNYNAGMETKEFKTEEEANAWANQQANKMDAATRQEAKQMSEAANREIQQAFDKAVNAEIEKLSLYDPKTVGGSAFEGNGEEDEHALDVLKGDNNKATEFEGATNSNTTKLNDDGSTTEIDVKGDSVTTTQNNKNGSKVITNTQGNTKEVTTINKDGSESIETTINDTEHGVTTVITENYDKKGRLRSSNRTVSDQNGASNTTTATFRKNGHQATRTESYNSGDGNTRTSNTQFRRNGSVKSEDVSRTVTADGMRFTEGSSVSFRRNGSIKSSEKTDFDGSKDIVKERRDGSLKSIEHQIGDGVTTSKINLSRGGDRLKARLYDANGISMKINAKMDGNTVTSANVKSYDANGHKTGTTDLNFNEMGTQVQHKGNDSGKINDVYSKYDSNYDGLATKSDKLVNESINQNASLVSKLDVGLEGDALTQFNKTFNANEKYMSKMSNFSETAKAALAKGQDANQVMKDLNNTIMSKLTESISNAVKDVTAEAQQEANKLKSPDNPEQSDNPVDDQNPKPELKQYKVQYGNTLSQIAKNHGVSLKDLMAVNPQITDPDKIKAGQSINLPEGVNPKEGPGNGVARPKAKTVNTPPKAQTPPKADSNSNLTQHYNAKVSVQFIGPSGMSLTASVDGKTFAVPLNQQPPKANFGFGNPKPSESQYTNKDMDNLQALIKKAGYTNVDFS